MRGADVLWFALIAALLVLSKPVCTSAVADVPKGLNCKETIQFVERANTTADNYRVHILAEDDRVYQVMLAVQAVALRKSAAQAHAWVLQTCKPPKEEGA